MLSLCLNDFNFLQAGLFPNEHMKVKHPFFPWNGLCPCGLLISDIFSLSLSPAFSIRKKVEGEVDKVGGGPAAAAAGRCRTD